MTDTLVNSFNGAAIASMGVPPLKLLPWEPPQRFDSQDTSTCFITIG